MYTVKNCLECGKPVSTSVSNCPHCQTEYPRGAMCQACKEAVTFSKSIKFREYNNYYKCFHNKCYQLIIQSFQLAPDYIYNYSCPVCKKSHQDRNYYSTHSREDHKNIGTDSIFISRNCDNCGHYIKITDSHTSPYTSCYFCKLILSKSNAVKVTVPNYNHVLETHSAHSYCYDRPLNQKDIKYQHNRVNTEKYEDKKREFWRSNTNPGCALIFYIIAGYFLIISKVWWLTIIGIIFAVYVFILVFLMIKYSS